MAVSTAARCIVLGVFNDSVGPLKRLPCEMQRCTADDIAG
jgi:hypothetical protein